MAYQEISRYIINFLYGENDTNATTLISYCKLNEIPNDCKIVIIDSGFFDIEVYGTENTLPELPLIEIEGIPVLYGSNILERIDGRIILYADLIASTFFLISRYEEIIRPSVRDKHGRFPGVESLPFKAGFITRPIVDEYGYLLRRLLREAGCDVREQQKYIRKIWLTHDIDIPWERFTAIKAIKRVASILIRKHRIDLYPILNLFGYVEHDPLYTFRLIIQSDHKIQEIYKGLCDVVYFIKTSGRKNPEDYYPYFDTPAFTKLLEILVTSKARLGMHFSYEVGINPEKCLSELNKLQKKTKSKITLSRHHYLDSREPGDMNALIEVGITDDFTMGYADVSGFRLGTCRAVNWIDPNKLLITSLTLHPLIIMDGTLITEQYMNLTGEESLRYCEQLISKVANYGGELSLLWHNNHFGMDNSLYWNNYIGISNYLINERKELQ